LVLLIYTQYFKVRIGERPDEKKRRRNHGWGRVAIRS
jgi:hypothetical protein